MSHKNRSQQLSCNFFSCRWILLLQRILDHATLQPCRSLDHLQKDNKDRQGPGERNQILQNNYDEPLISNFRPVHWTVFRISTEKSWSLPIIRSTFVHFLKIKIAQKHNPFWEKNACCSSTQLHVPLYWHLVCNQISPLFAQLVATISKEKISFLASQNALEVIVSVPHWVTDSKDRVD